MSHQSLTALAQHSLLRRAQWQVSYNCENRSPATDTISAQPSSSQSLLNIAASNSAAKVTRNGIQLPTMDKEKMGIPKGIPGLLRRADDMRRENQKTGAGSTSEEILKNKLGEDLTRQIKRRWNEGDIYAPHDLSPQEMKKWKTRKTTEYDVFDILHMNPIDEYKVFWASVVSDQMVYRLIAYLEFLDHVGIYDSHGQD